MGKSLIIKGADFSSVAINSSEFYTATIGSLQDSGSITTGSTYRAYILLSKEQGDIVRIKAPANSGLSFTAWNTDENHALVGNKPMTAWATEYDLELTTGYFAVNIRYHEGTTSDTMTQEQLNAHPFELITY